MKTCVAARVVSFAGLSEEDQKRNRTLYYIFTSLLEGPPFHKLKNLEKGEGLVVWRTLIEEYESGRPGANLARLNKASRAYRALDPLAVAYAARCAIKCTLPSFPFEMSFNFNIPD